MIMLLKYLIIHFICIIIAFIYIQHNYDEMIEEVPTLKLFPRYMIFTLIALIAPLIAGIILKIVLIKTKYYLYQKYHWYRIKLSFKLSSFIYWYRYIRKAKKSESKMILWVCFYLKEGLKLKKINK